MPYINSDGFFEQEYNFREFEKLFASKSKRVLSATDLTNDELVQQLSTHGAYAEIAHSSVDVPFVLQNLDTLSAPGFPLEGYDALRDLHHVRSVHSTIGEHQGYCATIPRTKTALLAFSGTAHVAVAFRLVWIWKTRFVQKSVPSNARLHYGFQKVYAAELRTHARKALKDAFAELGEVDTLILTGHSLGGTLSQFMLLEILEDILGTPAAESAAGTSDEEDWPWRKNPPNIVCTTFGSPRPGNKSFKKYYERRVAEYREKTGKDLKHWSIVGHRDGVPATPPGFAPVTSVGETFYLYHGDLYNVPVEEATHSIFKVIRDESRPARFEHGGHNYYSARDMERLIHRLRHIREDKDAGFAVEEWTKRYLQREEEFKAAQAKKVVRTWGRKNKSVDATHQAKPSTSSGPSHSPTSSEIDKLIEKQDETIDGQVAVEPSHIDWSKASLEDALVEPCAAPIDGVPAVSVNENDTTARSTTKDHASVPVFATAKSVAGESANDLAAAAPPSQ